MLVIQARVPDQTEQEAAEIVRRILSSVEGLRVGEPDFDGVEGLHIDVAYRAEYHGRELKLAVEAKSRITPQTAWEVCERFRALGDDWIPVAYAPVISERVAEILRKAGVGHVDKAGNCRIQAHGLPFLIERSGLTTGVRVKQTHADPFSTKYSRVVRAMLSEPLRGWKVRELQSDPGVFLSLGAVSKVRQALIEERYAMERDGALYLRDAKGLLEAWTKRYEGPHFKIAAYARGEGMEVAETIARYGVQAKYRCVLSGLSAAWRMAPETRFLVGSLYFDTGGEHSKLDEFLERMPVKRVDNGANLSIWIPRDVAVMRGARQEGIQAPVTSPLQTYLDLMHSGGRGEDAAKAIHDKYLKTSFDDVAKRAEKWRHEVP